MPCAAVIATNYARGSWTRPEDLGASCMRTLICRCLGIPYPTGNVNVQVARLSLKISVQVDRTTYLYLIANRCPASSYGFPTAVEVGNAFQRPDAPLPAPLLLQPSAQVPTCSESNPDTDRAGNSRSRLSLAFDAITMCWLVGS